MSDDEGYAKMPSDVEESSALRAGEDADLRPEELSGD